MATKDLMKIAMESGMKPERLEAFNIGDTVDVHVKIIEGEKERIQIFTGIVISRKGSQLNESFTVRRLVGNEGVERVFPLHSPTIDHIEAKKTGRTRRAKLYYLRDRVGKATRLAEQLDEKGVAVKPRAIPPPAPKKKEEKEGEKKAEPKKAEAKK